MTEIPRDWRMNHVRKRFATKILLEGNDYRIVEGFGNGVWVLSKIGEENFVLPNGRLDLPATSSGNGHSEKEDPLKSAVIYQSPVKENV